MKAELMISGVLIVATVLSLTLLFRARRLSVEFWSEEADSSMFRAPQKGSD
jgi:hypothetical protein